MVFTHRTTWEMNADAHPPKRPRVGERTVLACIGCKQKKLKVGIIHLQYAPFLADLECSAMTKHRNDKNASKLDEANSSFIFESHLTDCLVEDPATVLYRPRDYLQSLEARVAYLEGLLQQVNPEVALDHLGPNITGLKLRFLLFPLLFLLHHLPHQRRKALSKMANLAVRAQPRPPQPLTKLQISFPLRLLFCV